MQYRPYKGLSLLTTILILDGKYGNGILSIISLYLILYWASKGGGSKSR